MIQRGDGGTHEPHHQRGGGRVRIRHRRRGSRPCYRCCKSLAVLVEHQRGLFYSRKGPAGVACRNWGAARKAPLGGGALGLREAREKSPPDPHARPTSQTRVALLGRHLGDCVRARPGVRFGWLLSIELAEGLDVIRQSFCPPRCGPTNFFWTPARRIWIDKGAINTGA
jgi:hypothetical protein